MLCTVRLYNGMFDWTTVCVSVVDGSLWVCVPYYSLVSTRTRVRTRAGAPLALVYQFGRMGVKTIKPICNGDVIIAEGLG